MDATSQTHHRNRTTWRRLKSVDWGRRGREPGLQTPGPASWISGAGPGAPLVVPAGPVLAPEIGVDGGLAVDPFPEFVPPTSPRSPPGDWTLAVARTAGAGSGRFSGGWLVLVADPGQEADGAPAGIQSALGCGPGRRRWRHRGRPGLAWRCYPATFGDPLDPTALEPVEPVLESLDLYTHLCLPCPHHSY